MSIRTQVIHKPNPAAELAKSEWLKHALNVTINSKKFKTYFKDIEVKSNYEPSKKRVALVLSIYNDDINISFFCEKYKQEIAFFDEKTKNVSILINPSDTTMFNVYNKKTKTIDKISSLQLLGLLN